MKDTKWQNGKMVLKIRAKVVRLPLSEIKITVPLKSPSVAKYG